MKNDKSMNQEESQTPKKINKITKGLPMFKSNIKGKRGDDVLTQDTTAPPLEVIAPRKDPFSTDDILGMINTPGTKKSENTGKEKIGEFDPEVEEQYANRGPRPV
jgi:hypothetical protein